MSLRELFLTIKENPREAFYLAGLVVVAAALGGILIAHSDIQVSAGDKLPSASQLPRCDSNSTVVYDSTQNSVNYAVGIGPGGACEW